MMSKFRLLNFILNQGCCLTVKGVRYVQLLRTSAGCATITSSWKLASFISEPLWTPDFTINIHLLELLFFIPASKHSFDKVAWDALDQILHIRHVCVNPKGTDPSFQKCVCKTELLIWAHPQLACVGSEKTESAPKPLLLSKLILLLIVLTCILILYTYISLSYPSTFKEEKWWIFGSFCLFQFKAFSSCPITPLPDRVSPHLKVPFKYWKEVYLVLFLLLYFPWAKHARFWVQNEKVSESQRWIK